jgi:putative ubiquitin-RnfH superfamily antitoxin RatB of RatAB toxin-antitoxin module
VALVIDVFLVGYESSWARVNPVPSGEKDRCSRSVTLLEGMTVDPKGDRRIRMAEPLGNCSHINARSNQLSDREVTEVMQANRWSSNLIADPNEERRDVVRSERGRALWKRGEHEGICRQLGAGLGNPTFSP